MQYLVTGGAGFVGSHLVDRIVARGDRAIVLDDLSTGRRDHVHPDAELRVGSVLDARAVAEVIAGCDVVFHLAAVVGVRLVHADPLRAMTVNVEGTRTVLAAAAERRVAVVLASSSEVYGAAGDVPFREDRPLTLGPTDDLRGSYACTKALGEWLARAHEREHGLRALVVRLFNTVGPRQSSRYGMVLPRFVDQALARGPITVYGDGTQSRCFAHVRDVTRAILALADRASSYGRVFNVGSDREVSIRELAELVRRQAGTRAEIATVPFEQAFPGGFHDVPRRVPCLRRLLAAVGSTPATTLEAIVDDVIAARRSALFDSDRRRGLQVGPRDRVVRIALDGLVQ